MSRNIKTLLLVLVLGLLILVGYWEDLSTKKEDNKKLEEHKLLPFQMDEIKRLTWYHGNQIDYVVELQKDQWKLMQPVQSIADQATMASIVDTLANYKFTKKFNVTKEKLEGFGLGGNAKKVKIEFGLGNHLNTVELVVGNNLSTGYSTYSRIFGENVVYVGSQYLSLVTQRSMTDVRSKDLVDINLNQIESFLLENKGYPTIKLVKEQNGFSIVEPSKLIADQIDVNSFLKAIKNIKVVGFYDKEFKYKELDRLKLLKPQYKLTIVENGKIKELDFFKMDDRIWSSSDLNKRALRLSPDVEKNLNRSVLSFQDRKIFKFQPQNIDTIKINEEINQKTNGKWIGNSVANGDLTSEKIEALIVDLSEVKTARFIDKKELQDIIKRKPDWTIVLNKSYIYADFWKGTTSIIVGSRASESLFEIPLNFFDFLKKDYKKADDDHGHN